MAYVAFVSSYHLRLAVASRCCCSSASSPPPPLTLLCGKPVLFHHRPLLIRRRGIQFLSSKLGLRSRPNCSASRNPPAGDDVTDFCIIEGPETVQDFVQLQMQEIQDNIRSRRNKIFLLMEEVRRLRIQQRIKSTGAVNEDSEKENEMPDMPSSIPFLPNMTFTTRRKLYLTCFLLISGIILFGGFLAPTLELKLGLGGTSYEDFIRSLHLPLQLSEVDPIVASFSGGAVGVISALMVIEINNVEQQEKKRCKYCLGTGYLACARCSGSGLSSTIESIAFSSSSNFPLSAQKNERCINCSGAGKVMCTGCLCTGMAMASEHDLRIDPFD
ncbi:protein ORANGE-LIKE, chloroplastic [Nymphaea colorata]|nr:protein ORANGE-LIKE, chloroplastic [Nymphaea colorata]